MSLATEERAAISETLLAVGPDRPTLCAGWTTKDLLAHLLVRERQPWAIVGAFVPALSEVTDRAMRSFDDLPWTERVELLRSGPPSWSPFRIPQVDALANGLELFVHHEDVRRGEPGWQPRPSDPVRDAELWRMLERTGRFWYRRSPVGVILRRPDGASLVVKTGHGVVTVTGEPSELVLHACGRDAARVDVDGSRADLEAFARAPRRV